MSHYASLVEQQRRFFRTGATRPLEFRRAQLQRLHDALLAHEAELLRALEEDLHRSAHEAWFSEIALVTSEIRHALRHLPSWIKPQRRGVPLLARPGRAWVQPEPLGVALIL
ncbi:MAG: hypothetical protein RMK20_16945, partial [Verrucomicrobiales bacterium]|nr:hypothetical protein [Verrucomicrobiales bacterium]